jgi:hypothetical protein
MGLEGQLIFILTVLHKTKYLTYIQESVTDNSLPSKFEIRLSDKLMFMTVFGTNLKVPLLYFPEGTGLKSR